MDKSTQSSLNQSSVLDLPRTGAGAQSLSKGTGQLHIVNCLPVNDQERQRFLQAAPDADQHFVTDLTHRDELVWRGNIPPELRAQANIIIGNPPVEEVAQCHQLKWLQTGTAGVNAYEPAGILAEGAMLSGASGAFGQSVSEHMFAMMWSLMKNLELYRDHERKGLWQHMGQTLTPVGATVVIVGTGDLGSHFAQLVKAVGATTIGIRRSPQIPAPGIDHMFDFDALDQLLPQADLVALAVPASADTHHLLNARRLALLKRQAIVINAGRGDAIDCLALSQALDQGQLWAAGLDVTEPEPLPREHPLWTQPRCLITPHVAGGSNLPVNAEKIIEIAVENLHLYMRQLPVKNRVR